MYLKISSIRPVELLDIINTLADQLTQTQFSNETARIQSCEAIILSRNHPTK